MAINKTEFRATGGGSNNLQYISSRDEANAKICGYMISSILLDYKLVRIL